MGPQQSQVEINLSRVWAVRGSAWVGVWSDGRMGSQG